MPHRFNLGLAIEWQATLLVEKRKPDAEAEPFRFRHRLPLLLTLRREYATRARQLSARHAERTPVRSVVVPGRGEERKGERGAEAEAGAAASAAAEGGSGAQAEGGGGSRHRGSGRGKGEGKTAERVRLLVAGLTLTLSVY